MAVGFILNGTWKSKMESPAKTLVRVLSHGADKPTYPEWARLGALRPAKFLHRVDLSDKEAGHVLCLLWQAYRRR
jgi:hypothetical protein